MDEVGLQEKEVIIPFNPQLGALGGQFNDDPTSPRKNDFRLTNSGKVIGISKRKGSGFCKFKPYKKQL